MAFHDPVHTSLELVTGPTIEPVNIADVKCHMRVDHEEEDQVIKQMISAARIYLQNTMNVVFIDTTYDYRLDCFPNVIIPPRSPLDSVTSINYLDENGDSQLLATTEYTVDSKSQPGRIHEAPQKTWPTTQAEQTNVVTVRFVAGYGAARSDVPNDIKLIISMLAAYWFENREAFVMDGSPKHVPMGIQSLIQSRRVMEFH